MSEVKKKSKTPKIIGIIVFVLTAVFSSLYLFQKAQYNQAQVYLPNTNLFAVKISEPLELKNKNEAFYNWLVKQPVYELYEVLEPYFSKGLNEKDYSIHDLLGDKSIIYTLDKTKTPLVYIPLSNNDEYFISPVLEFMNSSPQNITVSGNVYSLKTPEIHFTINENAIIFSPDLKSLKVALTYTEGSEFSKQLDNEANNQIILNFSTIQKLLPENSRLTQRIKPFFGTDGLTSFNFKFEDEQITFESSEIDNSFFSLFEDQEKVSKSLENQIPSSTVNLSIFSTSNVLQLNENLKEHWNTNSNGFLDKRIDAKENLNIDIEQFFETIGEQVVQLELNTKRSQLSDVLLIDLKDPLALEWKSIATRHLLGSDTIYQLEELNINELLFGQNAGQTPLSYFQNKNKQLILYPDLRVAKHYLSKVNSNNTWAASKEKSKLYRSIQDRGQIAYCAFPGANISFLKRSSQLDIPFWNYLKNVTSLKMVLIENHFEGSVSFNVSEYEAVEKAKFLPVYTTSYEEGNANLYSKPHQLAPNTIIHNDDQMTILDNFGELINKQPLKGEILDINKLDGFFHIQTTRNHYRFNHKWNLVNFFSSVLDKKEYYLGSLTHKKHKYYVFLEDESVQIKDEKGAIYKGFEVTEGDVQMHEILGDIYFSHIKDNLLSVYTIKGKLLKKFPKNLEDKLAIPPFVFNQKLYVIFENGSIQKFPLEKDPEMTDSQILGAPQLVRLNDKPSYLAETSSTRVTVYDHNFKQLLQIRQPFGDEIKVSALTIDYLLIHDLEKHNAIICNRLGQFLTKQFPLTDQGKVVISRNRIYRFDKFEENFTMEYLKI